MAKNYFDRYVWLIDTINRHGHISKSGIDELWRRSPLSEKQEREVPECSVYRFRLVPTYDFRQEIMSHGSDYKVLSPDWLRDEIKADATRMYNNYTK